MYATVLWSLPRCVPAFHLPLLSGFLDQDMQWEGPHPGSLPHPTSTGTGLNITTEVLIPGQARNPRNSSL